MKLAICVPTYDTWAAEFGHSLALTMADLAAHDGPEAMRLVRVDGTIIADGRNDLIKDALDNGARHILWCDTDMVFRPVNVRSLLSRDVDIVAADYLKRRPPHTRVAAGIDGGTILPGRGIVEAQHAGMGLMLVRTDVYRGLERPWCGFWTTDTGTVGEDVWFCRKARANGFKVYVDRDASRGVGHVGKVVHET